MPTAWYICKKEHGVKSQLLAKTASWIGILLWIDVTGNSRQQAPQYNRGLTLSFSHLQKGFLLQQTKAKRLIILYMSLFQTHEILDMKNKQM